MLLLAWSLMWSSAAAVLDADDLARHWLAEEGDSARLHTLAAALWLSDLEARGGSLDSEQASQWRSEHAALVLSLRRLDQEAALAHSALSDGQFAGLMSASERAVAQRLPRSVHTWLRDEVALGQLAQALQLSSRQAHRVWATVATVLTEAGLEGAAEVQSLWAEWPPSEAEPTALQHARAQAARSQRAQTGRDWVVLIQVQAEWLWRQHQTLASLWWWMEGLNLMVATADRELARSYRAWFRSRDADDLRRLRQLDVDSPVVMALLEDAADRMANGDLDEAISDLNDASMRLALFASSQGFYLHQPVREDISALLQRCRPSEGQDLPDAETVEGCLEALFEMALTGLSGPELVGSEGPYSLTFLQRELDLVSWQRVRYLDGYLGWRLASRCELPNWFNPLEFSLVVEAISQGLARQPRWINDPRWREQLLSVQARAENLQAQQRARLDCLSGTGADRSDPVSRLLVLHEQALAQLAERLAQAQQRFYADHTRPGADIDLDAGPVQDTQYRPAALMVRPCADGNTCGARAELPVSAGLLALVPSSVLLADQLGLGTLEVCYDEVHWTEREQRPARSGDPRVANYFGRLSVELHARYQHAGGHDVIFVQRHQAEQARHYLFAETSDELLALSCAQGMAGQPIASQLSAEALGLVPDRLTYFTSLPTTAEAQLSANWIGGEGWQAQFAAAESTEWLVAVESELDLDALSEAIALRLDELVSRRERQLAARLTSPLDLDDRDELTQLMAEVAETSALLRRVLEIHYPRLIRHDPVLRAALVGEQALLTRDRVRLIRDRAELMATVPTIGEARLSLMQAHWRGLPSALREHGHMSPEFDRALAQVRDLLRTSASASASVEDSAGP